MQGGVFLSNMLHLSSEPLAGTVVLEAYRTQLQRRFL